MNTPEEEVTQVEIQDAMVVFQQDKAMLDTMIVTAKNFPRNIKRATENAIAVATLDKETAASCTYSVPRGGKPITGPSVHLARIIFQTWGNLRGESKVVARDRTTITSQAVCFDLESNVAVKVEVKRSIMGKSGRYSEDLQVVTGNAGNAIAFRNAVFAVIPKAVVDKVYKAAKQTITGDISDETKLIARRKQVVDSLKDTYNVTEVEILGTIAKASVSHIDAEDIVVLIGIGTAIKEGDTTVDQAFRKKKEAAPAITLEELQTTLELNKSKLTAKELADITRIIEKKEENSYAKAMKKLLDEKAA
jgi:hypothetical protein